MYLHTLVKAFSVFLLFSFSLSFLIIAVIVAAGGDSSEIPGLAYIFFEEIDLPPLGASWSKFSFLWCNVDKISSAVLVTTGPRRAAFELCQVWNGQNLPSGPAS